MILLKIVCLLVAIAYYTIAERKIMAAIQRRRGPNVVGFWGLLQPLADGLKLIAKEMVIPSHSNSRIFVIAPLCILTLGLLSWSILPFGCFDYSEYASSDTIVRTVFADTNPPAETVKVEDPSSKEKEPVGYGGTEGKIFALATFVGIMGAAFSGDPLPFLLLAMTTLLTYRVKRVGNEELRQKAEEALRKMYEYTIKEGDITTVCSVSGKQLQNPAELPSNMTVEIYKALCKDAGFTAGQIKKLVKQLNGGGAKLFDFVVDSGISDVRFGLLVLMLLLCLTAYLALTTEKGRNITSAVCTYLRAVPLIKNPEGLSDAWSNVWNVGCSSAGWKHYWTTDATWTECTVGVVATAAALGVTAVGGYIAYYKVIPVVATAVTKWYIDNCTVGLYSVVVKKGNTSTTYSLTLEELRNPAKIPTGLPTDYYVAMCKYAGISEVQMQELVKKLNRGGAKLFDLLVESNSISDVRYGLLVILALSSLTVYGLIIAGWASNSKYAFLGALRSAAQMISYEVSISLVIIPVIFMSGSLNFTEIVFSQIATTYYLFPLLPLSGIFFISMIAETNRTPFDLPEAEAELVAGYNIEYSSIIFAMFFLAEYGNMIMMSLIKSELFIGGWGGPAALPLATSLALKALIFCFAFVLVRATFPRYRYDQLMDIGWKIFLPVSTGLLLLVIGIVMAYSALPVVAELNFAPYAEPQLS